MKLIILLSVAVLASCDFPAPSETYGPPGSDQPPDSAEEPSLLKVHFTTPSFYQGHFPLYRHYAPHSSFGIPSSLFSSRYPNLYHYKFLSSSPSTFNGPNLGVLPPLSEIVPPSSIIPPIFGGGLNPQLPINPIGPQVLPPNILPPSLLPKPPVPVPVLPSITGLSSYPFSPLRYSYPYSSFYQNYYSKTPFIYPFTTFGSLSDTKFKKNTPKNEKPSNSYGPPEEDPASTENTVQADEPYPYEAASEASDTPPHKPAAEYGPPSKK
ncbi:hypothetical protein RUM44_003856 [Polyplax serrata]|uniref:Uncharacterized protein n=1 Tax=Polyplax serrata TaxID=468196 RepID=A0ABR1B193_POLSC